MKILIAALCRSNISIIAFSWLVIPRSVLKHLWRLLLYILSSGILSHCSISGLYYLGLKPELRVAIDTRIGVMAFIVFKVR